MTCIVGLQHKNGIIVAGDSAGCGADDVSVMAEPKVFRLGPIVIGYSGSVLVGQTIRYHLRLNGNDLVDMKWMARKFIPRLRRCLKEHGALHGREMGGQSSLIVAAPGALFEVECNFQVLNPASGFCAIGSPYQYAIGSLASTERRPALWRVEKALEVAARFSQHVRGPWVVECI